MKNLDQSVPSLNEVLHPALKEAFGYRLMNAALKYRKSLLVILDEYGLVPPQMAILKILEDGEEFWNQKDLGLALGLDKVGVLRMIDGLEEQRLVRRVTSDLDKREKMIEITKKGKEVIAELKKRNIARENAFLSPLTPDERETLKKLIMKL